VWSLDFSAATMLDEFEQVLRTIPFSAKAPGCTGLAVRAIDPRESPLVEMDASSQPLSPEEYIAVVREYLHSDCAFEALAAWDVWTFDPADLRWRLAPQPLELFCHGPDYDNGVWREAGHFQADIGFEHLFTGHARMLGPHPVPAGPPQDIVEARFRTLMSGTEKLREYHEKTRENIQKLLNWLRAIEKAIPAERYHLWSEGEENFEARLDEILAMR